jgi:processive 1,2-diacylglycerol beta-glucosyltransferase
MMPSSATAVDRTATDPVEGVADPAAVRVVVVSADVGESHAVMARTLVGELESRPDVEEVTLLNDFAVLGSRLSGTLSRGYEFHLGRVKWSYDLAYRVFTGVRVAKRFGELALYLLGANALAGAIAPHDPDVVVSTHPVLNPVLAGLRKSGRLRCPVASVVGPVGGHDFWALPGLDLHLVGFEQAVASVQRLAGPGKARVVRPLIAPEFFVALSREEARARLGLAGERRVVLVSGGGWGVGDIAGAIDACLALPDTSVVAVAGRNAALHSTLQSRHGYDQRVSVVGYTTRMRELLCAADAFVTTTAGSSLQEARACGCPTVCYGFLIGHVRDNVNAAAAHGIARMANDAQELTRELSRALEEGRQPIPSYAQLPTAAELTVALARGNAIDAGQRAQVSGDGQSVELVASPGAQL